MPTRRDAARRRTLVPLEGATERATNDLSTQAECSQAGNRLIFPFPTKICLLVASTRSFPVILHTDVCTPTPTNGWLQKLAKFPPERDISMIKEYKKKTLESTNCPYQRWKSEKENQDSGEKI